MRRRSATALFACALVACNQGTAEEQVVAAPEIAAVDRQDLNVRAEAAGLVEPITTVEIKSKASGEVTAVHVETGTEVTRGTLLAEIEPRDVRSALAQAEADLRVAEARAQTSAANARRVDQLRKQNVATEQELEATVLEEANARAQLIKARTTLELARERMSDVTIRAPLNGTVIEKTIEPGNIIASASGTFGGGTTLLKMADLSVVQVRALVDQTDIGKIQSGQQASVTVEAYPGRPFTGEVVKIEPQAVVDQNVTMFPVLVHLQNQERLLKPGMNTEVEIDIAERDNVIVIPNDAVVSMRDAEDAGKALGFSEDDMRKKLAAMRSARGVPRVDGPGSQVAAAIGARPNAESVKGSHGETARRNSGDAGNRGNDGARAPFSGSPGSASSGSAPAAGAQRATSRSAIVFVPGPDGPEPRMVRLGVNDWEYTEVLSGLQEGDKVFLMTAARLAQQQKERADRMRERSGMSTMRQTESGQQSGRR